MVDHRVIGALGIAFALGVATPASASPILGIELQETGYTTFSTTSSADPLIVFKNFGTFGINVEISNLVTHPLSLDLASLNVSTGAAGTLTIIASATGLTSPLGLTNFLSQFSGNSFGAATSATFQTYISDSNTMFGKDTSLASLSTTGSSFANSATNTTTTTDPFAITEVVTIKTSGQAVLSFDGSIAAAPEIDAGSGGAAIALLLGVLGLVGERRRRPAATA